MVDIELINQNAFGGCGEIGYLILPFFWVTALQLKWQVN